MSAVATVLAALVTIAVSIKIVVLHALTGGIRVAAVLSVVGLA